MKHCKKCDRKYRNVDKNFYKNNARKDGYQSQCKSCITLSNKKSLKKYKEKEKKCTSCGEAKKGKFNKGRCGSCYYKEDFKGIPLSIKSLYSQGKSSAKRRDLEWSIDLDSFKKLRENSCFYCQSNLPTNGHGLDRMDNSKGYTLDNVIPSCSFCNMLRGDKLTVFETIELIEAHKATKKKRIENVQEYNIDIDTFTVFFFRDIEKNSSEEFVKNIETLSSINPHKEIIVKLSSEGGDWYYAKTMYDCLRLLPNPKTVIGSGIIASSASYFFQAFDKRLLTENATMLLHYGEDSYSGHSKDFIKTAEQSIINNKDLELAYKKTLKVDINLENYMKHEKYLKANEVVQLGLADSILKGAY